MDISKSWALKPYNLFAEKEIENAVTFILEGKYVHDIRSEILGKGLGDIFDVSFEYMLQRNPLMKYLIENNPRGISYDFFKNDFQEFNEDIEVIKKNLKSGQLRDMHQKTVKNHAKFLENIEKTRFRNSKMKKDLFSRYSQARALVDSVVPHLAVFMHKNKINPEKLFLNQKERMNVFLKHLNSMNVLSILVLERDFSSDKQVISNDAYDMAHLSGAIPYCDVVVTEKMFAHITKKKKLDEMYDCVILDDLKSLSEIEPIKSKIQDLESV